MSVKVFLCSPTFTLHALTEETLEQPLAVLADSGPSVGVNGEGVRHLDPSQHHLLHPDGPAAPGQDPLPCLLMGPLLQRLGEDRRGTFGRIKNHMQEGSEGRTTASKGTLSDGERQGEKCHGRRRREGNQRKKEKEICHSELA